MCVNTRTAAHTGVQAHAHVRACPAGYPAACRARNRPSSPPPFHNPHFRPRRPYVHLLLPFCHPLFIRSPGTREETWPHASSHGPNNGGYTGLWPLFARSCFDEVGLRPHNAATFLFFSTSLLLSLSLPPRLLPLLLFRVFGLLSVRSLPVTICLGYYEPDVRP